MSNSTCLLPLKGLDDRISKYFPAYNKHQIAILRGLYMDKHPGHTVEEEFLEGGKAIKDLTDEDIEMIAADLIDMQDSLKADEARRLTQAMYNPISALSQLKDAFTPQQRSDRVNMIAEMFSNAVDNLLEKNPYLSRDEVIRGFTDYEGKYQYGVGKIFEKIRKEILNYKRISEINARDPLGFNGHSQQEWEHRARQWDLTFRNLGALTVMANRIIREKEGYNIAARLHYAAPSSMEDLETNQLSFDFDPEQETREAWQEQKDNMNPFASVSPAVRRLLGSLKVFNASNEAYRDDLGNPRKQSPSKMHQDLMTLFRGIQTEGEIITRLEECDKKYFPYAKDLISKLNADPILRTQFFADFSKVAQLYGMVSEKGDKHVAILNKTSRQNAFMKYLARVRLQRLVQGTGSIFTQDKQSKTTSVNKANIQALSNFIVTNARKKYYKGYGENTEISKEEYDRIKDGDNLMAKQQLRESTILDDLAYQSRKSGNYQELADIYDVVFSALGIEVSPFTYMAIIQDNAVARKLNMAIANLPQGLGKLENARDYIKGISRTRKDGKDTLDAMGEYIGKIYGIVDAYEGDKVVNRARFHDKDYFTDVQSSYLGRFRDTLKNMLSLDYKGSKVKEWLLQEYGHNPFFYDKSTGKFRVRWMQDLVTNPRSSKSFAALFDYLRLLGDKKQDFENFGNKTQTLGNLAAYFNAPISNYAWYPSFILGDSGVQKMIYAPKYNEKDIMDSFVEAAFQDIDLYKQMLAQKEALEKAFGPYYDSIRKPKNISESAFREQVRKNFMGSFADITTDRENIFALLPFLNNYDLDINSATIREDLRNAIASHLKEAFTEYKANLAADGVFARSPYDASRYQDSVINGLSRSTKKLIRNPKVYSPIYSPSASDVITTELDANLWQYFLNSRMAMMNQVQLMTISPAFYKKGLDGNSVDFQKRYKEIHAAGARLSADAVNPETGKRYSENFSQRVVYFNDPKTDSAETNSEFYEALREFDSENGTDLAEKYRESDSTDGQSVRTLDSYMQIMGMAGKLTPELLTIWQEINDVRANIRDNQREMTDTERKRYDELNEKFSREPLTAEEHEELAGLKEVVNGITREQVEELEGLMTALQPIKSFIYTWEQIPDADGNVTQIPVQIKHSECVMIPELLPKNSKMRHMMEWAEDNNVQMLSSDTCVKVGNYGGSEIHSATNREEVRAALDGAFVHELSYDGYIIQQNNPEHVRESRLIGTQGRKVSFSNLQANDASGNPIDYSNYLEDSAFVDGKASFVLGQRKHIAIAGEVKQQAAKVTHPNAHQINQLYVGLTLSNILEDFERFCDKISNPNKVRNILVQMTMNADRTNMENILGLEAQKDVEGKIIHDFIVPLFEGGVEHDNVALLLSIFRKQVSKQKMMGGSAIQASAFGISGMEESGNLKFRRDPSNLANILYAETEIPWDLSYTDSAGNEIPLEWNDWMETDGKPRLSDEIVAKDDPRYSRYMSFTDVNGVVHVPLIEQRFPGILDLVATRIPTEAKYSMLPLKIVRFTHKIAGGGTIRLPLQCVTMAGFDFDIDKLYFQRREFKYTGRLFPQQLQEYWDQYYNEHLDLYTKLNLARMNAKVEGVDKSRLYQYGEEEGKYIKQDFSKWLASKGLNANLEKYDYTKSPWDTSQSRVGKNNLLFNLIYSRLTDPNSIKDRFTPGGFEHIIDAADEMRRIMEIKDGAYDYADPYTLVVYNQQNQVAGKLIGIFALQNANAAMSSLMSKLELTTPIAFGSHAVLGLYDLLNPNALTKELLAASVDAVKNPCLNMLNLNTITASSGVLLCRLGYSFKDIGLLFNQPAIKNLTKQCLDNGITDVVTQIDLAIARLNANSIVDLSSSTINSSLTSDILEDSLRRLGKESRLDGLSNQDKKTQIKVLSLFRQILQSANELNKFVNATRFTASNSVKSTFGEMYAQQVRVAKYLENISPGQSLLSIKLSNYTQQETPLDDTLTDLIATDREEYAMRVIDNPFGYEQVMYDANKAALREIGKFFPYESMVDLMEKLADACMGAVNGGTINAFHNAVIKYMLSKDETSPFNENRLKRLPNGEEVSSRKYYAEYFPYRIQKTLEKYPELNDNPLFKLSTIDIDGNGNVVFKLADNGALTPIDKENVTNGWEQLIDMGFEDLAVELYMYNYFKDGFGFGVIGFNYLAPVSVKKRIELGTDNYLERLWSIVGYDRQTMNAHVNYRDMMTQFIEDNIDNYQLVYTPTKEVIKRLYDPNVTRNPFRLDRDVPSFWLDPSNKETRAFQIRATKDTVYWKPAIRIPSVNGPDSLYIARPTVSTEINNNYGFTEMQYVLAGDMARRMNFNASNEQTVDMVDGEGFGSTGEQTVDMADGEDLGSTGEQTVDMADGEGFNAPNVIDFGETLGTHTIEGFMGFAKNMTDIFSQRFPELGTSQEMFEDVMDVLGEDIVNKQSTSDAMNILKQVIKMRCEKEGYKGAVDGEVIC